MSRELLTAALRDAESSTTDVRAMALLRGARVLTKFDAAEAENTLEAGLALLVTVTDDFRTMLMHQAISLVGCVVPERAFALRDAQPPATFGHKLHYDMLNHGHVMPAISDMMRIGRDFPAVAAHKAIRLSPDDETRLAIVRRSILSWWENPQWPSGVADVFDLLRFNWRRLPDSEARETLQEMIRWIRAQRDERMTYGFGEVQLSSRRSAAYFELLGPLRRYDPALVEELVRSDRELQDAAETYPDGRDTQRQPATSAPPMPAIDRDQWLWENDTMQVGDGYFRMKDEEPGYDRPFAEADRLYRRESAAGRRQVPIESRFATDAYRMILYRVGRREGASAARLLDRISDRDARLFAQIELAAALAQLPEVGGICFG